MPGGNSFIKLTGPKGKVVGESMQDGHKDEIEIDDFNWEVTSDTSFTKGGGASVGKAMPGVCSWSHYYDTASPMIMLNCVIGTTFPEVKATMCKQTGDSKPEVYFTATMSDCYITKATINAGEDGSVKQSVEMVFKAIKIGYKKQLNSGKLDSTEKSFKWDVPSMVGNVE
jgi:type VI secretion system Hcp family effector